MSGAVDDVLIAAIDGGAMPGVVAIVVDDQRVVYEGAAGQATADTVFSIASMTKPLTSVAALQLVERGLLSLDQEVADVLPAHAKLEVLDGFDGETPRLRPAASRATVRQLLTHTAGHGYWFANADLLRYMKATGAPDSFSGRRAALQLPLVADPGTRWEYGTSTDWLGQVVEAVSGQPLDAYLSEHLFDPLQMTDATFELEARQRHRLLAIHDRRADGGLSPSATGLAERPEFWPGGHGVYATARDYGRFMRALLRAGELDGHRILSSEMVALAFSDHLDGIQLPRLTQTAVPELTNDMELLPFDQGFGLGFQLMLEDVPGMRRAGSGTWAGLFNSYFWVDHASGVGAALFTQVLPFLDGRVIETLVAFEQAVYAAGLGRA
jgi:methyl acetate hydrolase